MNEQYLVYFKILFQFQILDDIKKDDNKWWVGKNLWESIVASLNENTSPTVAVIMVGNLAEIWDLPNTSFLQSQNTVMARFWQMEDWDSGTSSRAQSQNVGKGILLAAQTMQVLKLLQWCSWGFCSFWL
jgi:hypothetical protein